MRTLPLVTENMVEKHFFRLIQLEKSQTQSKLIISQNKIRDLAQIFFYFYCTVLQSHFVQRLLTKKMQFRLQEEMFAEARKQRP